MAFDDLDKTIYVQDKIRELIHPIYDRGDSWNFRCPVCGDSKKDPNKKRGNYYLRTNSYHCFNCKFSAKELYIVKAFSNLPKEDIVKEFLAYSVKHKTYKKTKKKEIVKKKKIKENIEFDIKEEWVNLNEDHKKFLKLRRIFEAPNLESNQTFYWNNKSHRIVIPWIRNKRLVYYQERAYFKKQTPKYIFPSGQAKDLYGMDRINISDFPYIFITEGVFDSIFVKNCIACGGIFPTNEQIEEIRKSFPSAQLVWLPDNPYVDKSAKKEIIRRINNQCCDNFKIFDWTDPKLKKKDVNDNVIFINNIKLFYDKSFLKQKIVSLEKMFLKLKWD